MDKYNISDNGNFKDEFIDETIPTVIQKYSNLISEFLACVVENIVLKNEKYFIFILQRGLETIKHCFNIIYMYSKNIDLTIYHCKKAFCYYVEFIGQIGNDNHTYLQLNSKDATLFVYKKTIFKIDNDYMKKFVISQGGKQHIETISNVIDIYHELIMTMISKEENNRDKSAVFNHCIKQSCKLVGKLYIVDKSVGYNLNNLSIILHFIYSIKDPILDNSKYTTICELFIKKIKKKNMTIDILQEKLYKNEYTVYLENYTGLRFVNWLFTKF